MVVCAMCALHILAPSFLIIQNSLELHELLSLHCPGLTLLVVTARPLCFLAWCKVIWLPGLVKNCCSGFQIFNNCQEGAYRISSARNSAVLMYPTKQTYAEKITFKLGLQFIARILPLSSCLFGNLPCKGVI